MSSSDLLADPPASWSSIGGTPRPGVEPSQDGGSNVPLHHWQGVLDSAIDAVGHTPLIRLKRFANSEGFKCNILAKTEFFSVGGSIKDRIAKRMISKAEEDGRLVPGQSVIIEPTSGNTGIGLAMISAIKGYRCIITMPQKMSAEKEAILRSLGAEVVRTPSDAAWDSEESHIGVAKKLEKEIKGGIILDQYSNEHNPQAHYDTTFQEIQYSISTSKFPNKQIDLLVSAAGTGGTITGLSRAARAYHSSRNITPNGKGPSPLHGLEDALAECQIPDKRRCTRVIGVDPVGSILGGGEVGAYQVEGIGYDFFPAVLDPSSKCIDKWVKTTDEEAFEMNRRLIRTEGLLVGGSSGSALAGLLKYLKGTEDGRSIAQDEHANVVVILADGIRNYIGKDWFLQGALQGPESELAKEIAKCMRLD